MSKLNEIQADKKLLLLERLNTYMLSMKKYFQHGHELLQGLDPYMNDMTSQLNQVSDCRSDQKGIFKITKKNSIYIEKKDFICKLSIIDKEICAIIITLIEWTDKMSDLLTKCFAQMVTWFLFSIEKTLP